MKSHVACLAAALLAAGCCGAQDEEIAKQRQRITELEKTVEQLKGSVGSYGTLEKELKDTQDKLQATESLIAELEEKEKQAQARLDILKEMLGQFKDMISAGRLAVKVKTGKLTLELPSAILFPSGSAELSDKGKETLAEVAEVLKTIKGREFQVAGHTDNQPISKDNPFETNWHLSAARAVAVVIYLKECGVRPKFLSAAGYSQFQPAVPNKTKRNMARNRRIEITLMPNMDELPDLSDLQRELGEVPGREGDEAQDAAEKE